jgi:putative transcriptional regulator
VRDDLSKKVGVRRETILYMEKGKSNPSLKLAHEVAKVVLITINNLFFFDDKDTKQSLYLCFLFAHW